MYRGGEGGEEPVMCDDPVVTPDISYLLLGGRERLSSARIINATEKTKLKKRRGKPT